MWACLLARWIKLYRLSVILIHIDIVMLALLPSFSTLVTLMIIFIVLFYFDAYILCFKYIDLPDPLDLTCLLTLVL